MANPACTKEGITLLMRPIARLYMARVDALNDNYEGMRANVAGAITALVAYTKTVLDDLDDQTKAKIISQYKLKNGTSAKSIKDIVSDLHDLEENIEVFCSKKKAEAGTCKVSARDASEKADRLLDMTAGLITTACRIGRSGKPETKSEQPTQPKEHPKPEQPSSATTSTAPITSWLPITFTPQPTASETEEEREFG